MRPRALAAFVLLGAGLATWCLLPGSGALEAWLAGLSGPGPLAGLALLGACALLAAATLVSEDLTCLAAGALVAEGRLPFAAGTAACFAGILAGDVLLFLAGRWCGPACSRARPARGSWTSAAWPRPRAGWSGAARW
jgi:membrane protein DedA with SNARE-associated domain